MESPLRPTLGLTRRSASPELGFRLAGSLKHKCEEPTRTRCGRGRRLVNRASSSQANIGTVGRELGISMSSGSDVREARRVPCCSYLEPLRRHILAFLSGKSGRHRRAETIAKSSLVKAGEAQEVQRARRADATGL